MNEWQENTGVAPDLPEGTLVDVDWDGSIQYRENIHDWNWDCPEDPITKWRISAGQTYVTPKPVITYEMFNCPMEDVVEVRDESKPVGPIKSDGGSSSYYKLTIKTKDGSFECETGDVIAAMVGDNFALGNAVKALRRIWCDSLGMGKEGTDMEYDAKKINYFVKDFVERSKRK